MINKTIKKEKPEKTKEEIAKRHRINLRGLYKFYTSKRKKWAIFIQTPEGKEAIQRRHNACQIASRALKKQGYSMKELNPFRYLNSR